MFKVLLVMLLGYLLGSIPFGLLVARLVKKVDIRDYGSGNIGATNAYRLMGLSMGGLVALLDIGKGLLSVKLASLILGDQPVLILLAGIMAIAGHNWSLFLKFNGGRGVSTSVGVLISLAPQAIFITFFVWIIIILVTQYVSLASITGAILVPILFLIFKLPASHFAFSLLIASFVIYRHRPNIKRLLAGNENKVTWNKGGKEE